MDYHSENFTLLMYLPDLKDVAICKWTNNSKITNNYNSYWKFDKVRNVILTIICYGLTKENQSLAAPFLATYHNPYAPANT